MTQTRTSYGLALPLAATNDSRAIFWTWQHAAHICLPLWAIDCEATGNRFQVHASEEPGAPRCPLGRAYVFSISPDDGLPSAPEARELAYKSAVIAWDEFQALPLRAASSTAVRAA